MMNNKKQFFNNCAKRHTKIRGHQVCYDCIGAYLLELNEKIKDNGELFSCLYLDVCKELKILKLVLVIEKIALMATGIIVLCTII